MTEKTKDQTPPETKAAEPAKVMVKVRACRAFLKADGTVVNEGETAAVTPEEAAVLTKDSFGSYAFRGSRQGKEGQARHNLRRAEPVMVQATA